MKKIIDKITDLILYDTVLALGYSFAILFGHWGIANCYKRLISMQNNLANVICCDVVFSIYLLIISIALGVFSISMSVIFIKYLRKRSERKWENLNVN